MYATPANWHFVDIEIDNPDTSGALRRPATVADFFEAKLTNARMRHVKGAFHARNLSTTNIANEVYYFSTIERSWFERWLDWERIRILGRLPLFGISYAGLTFIATYAYAIGIYNEQIDALKAWITH